MAAILSMYVSTDSSPTVIPDFSMSGFQAQVKRKENMNASTHLFTRITSTTTQALVKGHTHRVSP